MEWWQVLIGVVVLGPLVLMLWGVVALLVIDLWRDIHGR